VNQQDFSRVYVQNSYAQIGDSRVQNVRCRRRPRHSSGGHFPGHGTKTAFELPIRRASAKRCGLRLVILAGLVWAERKQFYGASEGTEGLSVPRDRLESGKGAKLRGKVKAVSFSEVRRHSSIVQQPSIPPLPKFLLQGARQKFALPSTSVYKLRNSYEQS
jgi:hypothetical protein